MRWASYSWTKNKIVGVPICSVDLLVTSTTVITEWTYILSMSMSRYKIHISSLYTSNMFQHQIASSALAVPNSTEIFWYSHLHSRNYSLIGLKECMQKTSIDFLFVNLAEPKTAMHLDLNRFMLIQHYLITASSKQFTRNTLWQLLLLHYLRSHINRCTFEPCYFLSKAFVHTFACGTYALNESIIYFMAKTL